MSAVIRRCMNCHRYPLKLYKLRWAIETNYYEQKTFWSLNAYRIRRQNGI